MLKKYLIPNEGIIELNQIEAEIYERKHGRLIEVKSKNFDKKMDKLRKELYGQRKTYRKIS